MKTIRITLTKPGAQAVCELQYHYTHEPRHRTWTGNRSAFLYGDGRQIELGVCLTNLEAEVAHKAANINASYTIEDLGGEAIHVIR